MTLPIHACLLDNMNTGLLLLDQDLCLQYINPAAEAILAISDKRCQGLPFSQFLYEPEQILSILNKALESDESYVHREASLHLHNHMSITLDLSISLLQMEHSKEEQVDKGSKNKERFVLIELQHQDRLKNITNEQQFVHQQRTTRSFLRGLAHEIKNPLGGIRGGAQLLERELPNQSLKEYTQVIIAEADRLRDLVDKMLGSNKKPNIELMNIHQALERVTQLIEAQAHNKLTVIKDYDPSIPDVLADKNQIIQAMLNISQNAQQVMEEHGTDSPTITLTTRVIRKFTLNTHTYRLALRIDIADNGPGVPDKLQGQLFYPMVSGRADGTGLGLSISQNIINQFGGIIKYKNAQQGAVFSVYLPLEDSMEKA